ncbi:MAG: L-arabinose isomerase family protein [Armatimonadota bacterium]
MDVRPTRVGLLPLYLALYDEVRPEARPEMEQFAERVASRLEEIGLQVDSAPVSRLRTEVEGAVRTLLHQDMDCLATVHLAYSPSLEALDALVDAGVPLVLLDTTPAPQFGEDATQADMFRNHGIHGVQDLACMLRRRGRPYLLAVGHIDDEAFAAEVRLCARAAHAAHALGTMRVLVIGEDFEGMGDFAVSPEVMAAKLGIEVRRVSVGEVAQVALRVAEDEVAAERERDYADLDCSQVAPEMLDRTNRVGLAVRRIMEEGNVGAMSFNFASFTAESGVETVPFLEASKAMARGEGYAGEADALTAALVGSLAQAGCRVTFTEMFCPDWAGGSVFMSHMGECSLDLAAGPAKLVEKQYDFSEVANPAIAIPTVQPGEATLVNLAPGPGDTFDLIAARVEVLDRGPVAGFPEVPHFWIRPLDHSLPDFLRRYSELGGTHHLALCLGDEMELARRMATLTGIGFHRV